MKDEKESQIYKIRHSLAHLLAIEVLKFDSNAKLTIGPVIENGFYYDVDFGEGKIPTEKDLKEFQKGIKKSTNKNLTFIKEDISPEDAKKIFAENPYKIELINDLVNTGEKLSIYKTGDFVDLCSGPHIKDTSEINTDAFKITNIAGAYWRGNEKNKMLTRIYGVAFETKEELEEYEKRLVEAAQRDHRKIGKEMNLFTFSDLVGSGLPMFTPKGMAMRTAIVKKIGEIQERFGFQEVWIPHITKPDLYKTSGHWDKFGDELFKVKGRENEFVMKPMNCPHHTQIFASSPKSYKDLPVRYSETTTVYRDEQAGELLGLSRVRSLTQDDGHTFCTPDQIEAEIKNIISVMKEFYTSLELWSEGKYQVFLSVRDSKNKEKYLGDDAVWEKAENVLRKIADDEKLPVIMDEGGAAFYGPKLDFKFKDSIGRIWQLATVQLDFNMPARFKLEYTDKDGQKKTPVMIHRAIAGSLERFLSVIIEHFAGNFPFWMAPVQIKIIPVAENHNSKAEELFAELKKKNIRVELDSSSDGFGKKIRKAKVEKVPYFVIIGDKEISENKFTLESRDSGNLGMFSDKELLDKLK
ncbi:MAG TPA: threonine--tRNA ligase [Candidatus Paceibacterota bacterium]|nr:threonine--tRNA ligase [Candidatus Paceibacterota bacterium]HMP18809.1 threonine--tRNA ligase [Candidatus Paceibacterota bacterium]HMP85304.1 threonine--tRNA ligase [Candidatus Paceibacterota bacterium]